MKKFLTAAAVALSLSLFSVQAQSAGCYNASEFEAEQGLRIHSELMVIGLTCMKMPQGAAMYSKYQQFTRKNQRLIAEYEEGLINYYRRQGVPNPEKEFHTLRTSLANGISKHAVVMSTSSFCANFGKRIDKALEMDQQNLRKWAQHVWPQSPTTRPVCGKV
jgi:hypothetical protein